jgi:hypothetical protein
VSECSVLIMYFPPRARTAANASAGRFPGSPSEYAVCSWIAPSYSVSADAAGVMASASAAAPASAPTPTRVPPQSRIEASMTQERFDRDNRGPCATTLSVGWERDAPSRCWRLC